MKKLVYKNKSGNNPRKREISMEEVKEKIGSVVYRKWGSKYFIKERFSSYRLEDLKKWVAKKKKRELVKNFHILRRLDTRTGEHLITCKVIGTFFIIRKRTAYEIVYVNEVKVRQDGRSRFNKGRINR